MTPTPEKPILLYITPPGPNSWKTVFLLEELGLNYKLEVFRFDEVKKPSFLDLNPNGRVPTMIDPNTNLTLWESGAINQYIIEQYDVEKRLTYTSLQERNLLNQWLQFQMSGQGPYFGQCSWFQHVHHENLPSVIERYTNEIKRVIGVTESYLSKKDPHSQWLVGDKMTYADMAFVPWNCRLSELLLQSWDELWKDAPRMRAWHERMVELSSWKRSMEIRARYMDEQGLQLNGIPKGFKTFAEFAAKMAEMAEMAAAQNTAARD